MKNVEFVSAFRRHQADLDQRLDQDSGADLVDDQESALARLEFVDLESDNECR
jgi:hypothetical protein